MGPSRSPLPAAHRLRNSNQIPWNVTRSPCRKRIRTLRESRGRSTRQQDPHIANPRLTSSTSRLVSLPACLPACQPPSQPSPSPCMEMIDGMMDGRKRVK